MNGQIKAIETHYNGYRFRSRLEARWAVFFDVLGIAYVYEPEKFGTDHGAYIPDFFLPSVNLSCASEKGSFVEIKPTVPEEAALRKILSVPSIYVVSGLPGEEQILEGWCGDLGFYACFGQCPKCGSVMLVNGTDDRKQFGPCFVANHHECPNEEEFARRFDIDSCFLDYCRRDSRETDLIQWKRGSPTVRIACETAKLARFESDHFEHDVACAKTAVRRLHEDGVFCYPETLIQIVSAIHTMLADPDCPRYVPRTNK